MLIELDYETVSALESALIAAEVSKERDAKEWRNIAELLEASERRQNAEEMAEYCRKQADRFRATMAALQEAKKEGPHA